MTDQLLEIASEARNAGHLVELREDLERLLVMPSWNDPYLRDLSHDIVLEVNSTPVGLRFNVYEAYAGSCLLVTWADQVGLWFDTYCRRWVANAYWWSYREIWGWQVALPWPGLDKALEQTTECARQFDRLSRFPELMND